MADAGKDTARERELKFKLDSADVGKIGAHPLLAGRLPETRRLISVYFDTEDFALRDAGVALRLRGTDEDRVQTIKAAGPTLFDRPEWEHRVVGSHPDLGAAEATGLAPLMDEHVRKRLQPLFKTSIERTVYHLDRNGSEIELALDRGEVEADSCRAPILEMELELKRGHPAELFHLARELAVSVPLKFQREGIRYDDLTSEQQGVLRDLIGVYLHRLRPGHAEIRLEEAFDHLPATHFSWIGAHDDHGPFYYRIYTTNIAFFHNGYLFE